MSKLVINGGIPLNGEAVVHGAKNSILPIMAATVICDGENVIHNCPRISDVDTSIKILTCLGCKCRREGSTVTVDSSSINCTEIPENLMREMRSSIVFFGAVAARCGKVRLSSPGGCELGPRPIDIHLSALSCLGVDIEEESGFLCGCCKGKIKGKNITLTFPSVGATENIMLSAATAQGTTVICNAAREPEICDLADFLNKAGANVKGAGTDTVVISGVNKLHGAEHSVIPDRIETATLLSAVGISGGKAKIMHTCPNHLLAVIDLLRESGCLLDICGDSILITAPKRLGRIKSVRTLCYPGFPTDSGPPLLALTTLSAGVSVFEENIFENRFRYIDELKRLGAKINVHGKIAVVDGVKQLKGANVFAADLRGGAALIVAGLAANGITTVDNMHFVDRGYESFENTLSLLGGEVKRI